MIQTALSEKRTAAMKAIETVPLQNHRHGLTTQLIMNDFRLEDYPLGNKPAIAIDGTDAADPRLFSLITPTDRITAYHIANASIQIIRMKGKTDLPVIIRNGGAGNAADHLLIIAEKGSMGKVIEIGEGRSAHASFRSAGAEIFLEEEARLDYTAVQMHDDRTFSFAFRRAKLGRDAHLAWNEISLGGKTSVHRLSADLIGIRSEISHQQIFFTSHEQQTDMTMHVTHAKKESVSSVGVHGVVSGQSKGISECTIHIGSEATSASGRQDSSFIILDDANANAIPILKIDNPDVTCGHSARIGHIDENMLFYMESRGLSQIEAKRLIIEGFFAPGIDRIPDRDIAQHIMEAIIDKHGHR